MPDITLVIVNYFSSELAAEAIASARNSTSSTLHVTLVDNSVDESEAAAVRSVGADEVIISPDNRGYSGGANLGVADATTPIVVVSNPDVVFGDGCLDRLAGQLGGDVAVAGPLFHWDADGDWILPPAEVLDWGEKASQVLASRFDSFARRRNRKRTRSRLDFWRRQTAGSVDAVAGAVMAIDKAKLDAVSGFDESFELYFEEIDLARRLTARGWQIRYVPSARCRHLYNQSAVRDSEAAAKFCRSEETYLRRWAPLALPFRDAVAGGLSGDGAFTPIAPDQSVELPNADDEWLIEAAPFPSFDSASGRLARGESFRFPEEIWASCAMPTLFLRIVDPTSLDVVRRFAIRR